MNTHLKREGNRILIITMQSWQPFAKGKTKNMIAPLLTVTDAINVYNKSHILFVLKNQLYGAHSCV